MPWSLPSVTIFSSPAANCLCIWTNFSRSFSAEAMYRAFAVTSDSRICAVTSTPLIKTINLPSFAAKPNSLFFRTPISSSSLFISTPACIAANVTARYIAPVSRKLAPSLSANSRATVLLPLAAGPSIVTIKFAISKTALTSKFRLFSSIYLDNNNACVISLSCKPYKPPSISEDIFEHMFRCVGGKLFCGFQ